MRVKLGDIVEQIRGVSYNPSDLCESSENGVILLRANNIQNGEIVLDDVVYVSKEKIHDSQYLKQGDILICTSSGSKELVGKAAFINKDLRATFGAFCKVVRPQKGYNNYIGHFFQSSYYRHTISAVSSGANINNLRNEHISDLEIPLPPLETQRHIATVLDKVSALIALRRQQLDKLDELVKSRFVEMFGTENDFDRWNCCRIGDVADIGVGVVIKPTQYYADEGIPAFRSLNVGEMHVNDYDWVYFTKEGHQKNQKSVIHRGDVLVVRSGAPGTACVATEKYEGYNAVDIIIAHPDNRKVNSVFLAAFTNMPHGMNQIRAKTGGAAQQHFNVGGYKSMRLIMPSIELQNQFAAFVTQTEKTKAAVQQALEKLETLKKALMQEYFGGEV